MGKLEWKDELEVGGGVTWVGGLFAVIGEYPRLELSVYKDADKPRYWRGDFYVRNADKVASPYFLKPEKAQAHTLQMAEEWLTKMLAEVRAAKEGK